MESRRCSGLAQRMETGLQLLLLRPAKEEELRVGGHIDCRLQEVVKLYFNDPTELTGLVPYLRTR
ncbi:hypothetical protein Taro_036601 [Colocasia esculenta]|uniref:Uncharacterized protein n=1 Tax=Colocasia esculenta TaxID=4460 RepID=A0A843WM46_COLES|nr:hypothetical protein [Colocasia esculenta]